MKARLCWFCGKQSEKFSTGWSLRTMIESDFRLECPQPNEFDHDTMGPGGANAVICKSCIEHASTMLNAPSERYINNMNLLRDAVSIEMADLGMHMIHKDSRQLHYGCWFDSYPIGSDTQCFYGMQLSYLNLLGVDLFSSFNYTKSAFDYFIQIAKGTDSLMHMPSHEAINVTSGVTLEGRKLTEHEAVALCSSHVWIIDMSVYTLANE